MGIKMTSRLLYHIGRHPAIPQPKSSGWQAFQPGRAWRRPWLSEPVERGVFLTSNPVHVFLQHSVWGNVYAYKVPVKVIVASGGLHRYDGATEILIPERLWHQVKFLGKSMTLKDLCRAAENAYRSLVRRNALKI